MLNLSPDLSVPLDVVTYTTAILGIRGTGKTNTATNQSATSSAYGEHLKTLRSFGLIEARGPEFYATELLFPKGLK